MRYPIGIQQFEEIRTGGWVYVDKTAQVYNLAKEGKYFFSEPSQTIRQEPTFVYTSGLLRGQETSV